MNEIPVIVLRILDVEDEFAYNILKINKSTDQIIIHLKGIASGEEKDFNGNLEGIFVPTDQSSIHLREKGFLLIRHYLSDLKPGERADLDFEMRWLVKNKDQTHLCFQCTHIKKLSSRNIHIGLKFLGDFVSSDAVKKLMDHYCSENYLNSPDTKIEESLRLYYDMEVVQKKLSTAQSIDFRPTALISKENTEAFDRRKILQKFLRLSNRVENGLVLRTPPFLDQDEEEKASFFLTLSADDATKMFNMRIE